ncbi:unnamed protein product [Linum tenue]|uniref:Alpha/beta hydrolase fold-3 domain-containing protein n=1 Tax=Linum tenue TaxID=586396 RepID=A0AAV0MM31_9ROSI|nr:unnamed protein product [Linum tenue]
MASDQIAHDFPGFFKVYQDGRVERYWDTDHSPAGLDPETGVESKDVLISPEPAGVKARIFLPKVPAGKKLPVLLHYHGGGFCIGSPFATPFKIFLSTLATQSGVIAISVDYRLAPEHKLPTAYDDCWAGLQWLARHADGRGPEPWLNQHADLGNVVLAGESAGANLAHYVAVQAGAKGVAGLNLTRMVLVHPYFGTDQPDRFYQYMCPTSSGAKDDPRVHPAGDPDLAKLKVGRILVCVAEKDGLRGRGVSYAETMKKSEWKGAVDFFETKGEDHCFHFFSPKSESIAPLIKTVIDFVKQDGGSRL